MKSITLSVARPAIAGGSWRVVSGGAHRDFLDDPKGRAGVEDHVLELLMQLMHPEAYEEPAAPPDSGVVPGERMVERAAERLGESGQWPLFAQEQAERLAQILHPQGELTLCELPDCGKKAIHFFREVHLCHFHWQLSQEQTSYAREDFLGTDFNDGRRPEYGGSDGPG